jgi:ATP-binding cassette subfamily B multidrug efflux pump
MQEFMGTAYGQMRLVTGFEVVNTLLSRAAGGQHRAAVAVAVDEGLVGVGAVAAATAMALRLNGISALGDVGDGLAVRACRHGAGRHGTLAKPRSVNDRPGAQALQVPRGEVRFERVRFAYGGSKKVDRRLDLVIRPGEKIGLVGRSGAGKSTVVNLLLRLYDLPAGGRILVDGQDIAGVTQDSLRRQIGMVTQDTSLLHRSVRDNILYGRPEARRRRHAARLPSAPRRTTSSSA